MPGPSLEKELAQPLQLGFASEEPAAPAWRVRVWSRTGDFPLLGRRHVRNEADAAAVDRLDEEGMAGIVAERPAQLGDHLRHGSGPDFHVRPDGVAQLGGGREPTRVLDEISQDLEGLGSQVHRRVCPPQTLILEIEPERRKLEHLGASNKPPLVRNLGQFHAFLMFPAPWRATMPVWVCSLPALAHSSSSATATRILAAGA